MSGSVGIQAGRICPRCGREESVPVVWGMPAGDLFEDAEHGLVVLGGCLRDPDGDPEWTCRACGLEWGRQGDPTADEQPLTDLLGVGWPDVVRLLGAGWRREDTTGDGGLQWFPAEVTGAAESIAARRRRWCRTCRRPSAPEAFDSAEGACTDCLAAYERLSWET